MMSTTVPGRRATTLAWALVVVTVAASATTMGLIAVDDPSVSEITGGGTVVPLLGFAVLGAFVIRQRGSHIVGWLMIGLAMSLAFEDMWEHWAQRALVDHPGSLPLGDFASWMQAWGWIPGWILAVTLLPAVFPDGHPVGRRRLLAWVDAGVVAAIAIAIAIASWHLRGPQLLTEAEGEPGAATLDAIATAGILASGVLAIISFGSLALRVRRAPPDVQRQIAWAAYGAAIAVLVAVAGAFLDLPRGFHALQAGALMGGVAIAMLRYRLYDIDVVINRTLVYGSLTGLLTAAYLGSVLLLQLVISPSSSTAIVASTLAVAALFRPLRARVQRVVDRRFFRRRYDAQRTLEAFTARLRDEVSPDAVQAELTRAVRESLQPTGVSFWIRPR